MSLFKNLINKLDLIYLVLFVINWKIDEAFQDLFSELSS